MAEANLQGEVSTGVALKNFPSASSESFMAEGQRRKSQVQEEPCESSVSALRRSSSFLQKCAKGSSSDLCVQGLEPPPSYFKAVRAFDLGIATMALPPIRLLS